MARHRFKTMSDKKMKISITTFLKNTGLTKLNTGLKAAGRLAKSAGGWLKKMGGRAVIGGIVMVTAAIWKMVGALKAFAVQELSEVNLLASLKQMGVYTEQYHKKLLTLASALQETTKIGDEVWLKQFAQLTRFGMNSGNVDKVSEAVKNLAGLMEGNLQGATLAMQRALEGEFSMFSRYGIKLDLTGDKVVDLNNLFEMLAQKGAGAMEARALTLQGAWDGLTNAIGDFKEEIGRTFERATNLRGILGSIETYVKKLQESAKSGGLKLLVEGAVEKASEFLKSIQNIVAYIQSEGGKAVADMANASKDIVIGLFQMGAEAAAKFLAGAIPAIGKLLGKAAKDAFWGKDAAGDSAKSRANFEAQRRARAQTDEELGPFDKSKGLLSKANRARDARRKQLTEKYYKELLPSYLSDEKQKERDAAASSVGGGGGRARFDGGVGQLRGMEALGQEQRDAELAEKNRRAESQRQAAALKAQQSADDAVGFGQRWAALQQAEPLYRQQQKQEADAARAGAPNRTGPTADAARESLSRERAETAEVARLISAVQAGDTGLMAAMLDALQRVVENQNTMKASIQQNANQIKSGRS